MDEERDRRVVRSRRRHERVLFKYQVVLELTGEKKFSGITKDVSLGGMFLNLNGRPVGVESGSEGVLRLTVLNLEKRFPCRVVYVTDLGVGLELFDKEENFGATLTASLMQDTLSRLGTEVPVPDSIRLQWPDAPVVIAKRSPES